MSRDSLFFEVPLPANLGNSRMHWRAKHGAKLAYWKVLDMLVMAKQLPMPPEIPWQSASAGIVMRTYRRADTDNCYSRAKWLLDWLESRGYVQNDRDVALTVENVTAPLKECGITLALVAA